MSANVGDCCSKNTNQKVVDFGSRCDKVLNMKKNTITYEVTIPAKTQKITMVLPPGRYLKEGEKIAVGDMRIWTDDKPSVYTDDGCGLWRSADYVLSDVKKWQVGYIYRPEPKRNKSKPKYRFLKGKEIIKKGDQYLEDRKWVPSQCVGEQVSYSEEDAEELDHTYRRRLHVKKS
jgi:hypothetical protein